MPAAQIERPPEGVSRDAVAAAERAIASTVRPSSRTDHRHADEIAALEEAIPKARSAALARAIRSAIPLKEAAHALCKAHGEAEERARDLELGGADEAALAEAAAAERDADGRWQMARGSLEAAALGVLEAPVCGPSDVTLRAEAFADLVGRQGAGTLPESEEDQIAMLSSYRDAVQVLAAREPDRSRWDAAVKELRCAEWRLTCANREEGDLRQAAEVEPGVMEALDARIRQGYVDRDTARTKLLALDPPDVGGLLVKMEIVFDHAAVGDVTSYASRARLRGEVPITSEYLWDAEDETLRPAFAMLAIDAAKLQDRTLPADWQEFIAGAGYTHPNFRDAVQRAIEAGMNPRDLISVRLDGREAEHKLPVLTFGGDAPAFATPEGCWVWKPVERLVAEPVQ
jgi:hypothetical protein